MGESVVYVGVDVSKHQLDYALSDREETSTVPNTDEGVQELVDALREVFPALVVMEATGGFEVPAAAALAAADIPVVVANPRQVRDFAKSTGQLAKTDRSMPASWRCSLSECGLRSGPCRTRTRAPWMRS